MGTPNNRESIFERVYEIVRQIPAGKVATYGQIAALLGPGMPPRIVGFALHGLPEHTDIPWHRVVNAKGMISLPSDQVSFDLLQQQLLEKESVKFDSSRKIDFALYLWRPLD
ncbi:MAG: methyltransferase [Calditrichales bacterium]|nr:MAG: methyltransferase [Calditrichales bacterium]